MKKDKFPKKFKLFTTGVSYCIFSYINKKGECFGVGKNFFSADSTNHLYTPKKVFGQFQKIRKICSGNSYNLIHTHDRKVFSIGIGAYGRLALGDFGDRDVPTQVTHFGSNPILNVFAGTGHCLFLVTGDIAYSSGWNYSGQLGLGHTQDVCVPTKVKFNNEKIIDIAPGRWFTCFLSAQKQLYVTGTVTYYGDHREKKKLIPELMKTPCRENIVKVSSGYRHFLVLTESGNVYGQGSNKHNCIDNGTKSVLFGQKISRLSEYCKKIVDVECGSDFSLVLLNNGNVIGMGKRDSLGIEKENRRFSDFRSLYKENFFHLNLSNIVQIECGLNSIYCINSLGEVFVGGSNGSGCLGIGNEEEKLGWLGKNENITDLGVIDDYKIDEMRESIWKKVQLGVFINVLINMFE